MDKISLRHRTTVERTSPIRRVLAAGPLAVGFAFSAVLPLWLVALPAAVANLALEAAASAAGRRGRSTKRGNATKGVD